MQYKAGVGRLVGEVVCGWRIFLGGPVETNIMSVFGWKTGARRLTHIPSWWFVCALNIRLGRDIAVLLL